MSRTIFRGTTQLGRYEREVRIVQTDWQVAVSIWDGGFMIGHVVLDLDMAGALADHLRDRVDDMRAEQEAKS